MLRWICLAGFILIGLGVGGLFLFRGETKGQAKARRQREEARKVELPELSRRYELSRFMIEELGYTHDQESFEDLTLSGGKVERAPLITDDGLRAQWFLGSAADFGKGSLTMWGKEGQSRRQLINAMEVELNISHVSYPVAFREGGKRVLQEAELLKIENVRLPSQSKDQEIDGYRWQVSIWDERPTPNFEKYSELMNYKPTGPEQWRIQLFWWPIQKP